VAHAIWSGSISFGLVTIPVKLFTAVRDHGLHFHLLHKSDHGRIHNVRRCEVCGKEVAWEDLERGFEYEKGEYVTLTDRDLRKANVRATQSVDILAFVDRTQIDPMLYESAYWLVPEKKGRHAYALLRDALAESGKVGIAKVVIRTREHPAAVEPHGDALVLELMHFEDEIQTAEGLEIPGRKEKARAPEMKAARMLIDTMASDFHPEELEDKYTKDLLALIDARAHHRKVHKGKAAAPPAPTVVNLMDVLKESLAEAKKEKAAPGARKVANGAHRRRRAS
jgi:DNA end-binding protein Ku